MDIFTGLELLHFHTAAAAGRCCRKHVEIRSGTIVRSRQGSEKKMKRRSSPTPIYIYSSFFVHSSSFFLPMNALGFSPATSSCLNTEIFPWIREKFRNLDL